MQKVLAPVVKDNEVYTSVELTNNEIVAPANDSGSSNTLNGLLSVSCAQISSHPSKDYTALKQSTQRVSPPVSTKVLTKESAKPPGNNSCDKTQVANVKQTLPNSSGNGGAANGQLAIAITQKKPNSDSMLSAGSRALVPGSLRPPTTANCRYLQSYIVCGTNGIKLVTDVLDQWKWHKLIDKTSTQFTLKWSDLRQSIDFHSHREGEQMVNHYPNSSLLTTKIGLLESLRNHKNVLLHLRLHVNQILPETYRMDVPTEREEFFQSYKPEDLWICKPTGANQGKGIFLVKTLQQLQEKLQADERNCPQSRRPTARIVQRYISKPLLLEGRKFDIRVYLLFVSGEKDQLFAFYHHGYIRLSCLPYDTASSDMTVHLTNQYVQKKHPSYQDVKEDTVWDFNKFQAYLTEHEKLPCDWVEKTLKYQIKRVMLGLHHSVRHKLEQRIGYFELFGLDFMLDSDHHLWLIEVNVNPALNTNCDVLLCILPGLIEETLGIATEVCSKSRRSKTIFPIEAQRIYEKVYPL